VRMKAADELTCQICGAGGGMRYTVPAESVRGPVLAMIKRDYPEWDGTGCICLADLNKYRARYVEEVLESERGEVTALRSDVSKSLEAMDLMTKNVNEEFDRRVTLGERMADKLADFGGSWRFIGIFASILVLWVLMNTAVILVRPFDPYPFIFLNLVLSCLAAIQAPVIMMSQNRQEAKDRFRAEHDFRTNLMAELEIRSLHDKLDYLLMHQWQRLLEIQEIQMELMEQLMPGTPESKGEGEAAGT
jgi:uncharacterized membrane protein